jgi:hypothetical protein
VASRRVPEEGLALLAARLRRAEEPDLRAAREQVAAWRRPPACALESAAAEQLVLPLRIASSTPVEDCPLACPVRAVVCVARQIQSELEMKPRAPNRPRELARHDGKRGRTPTRPTCVTERCAIGREVRAAHGDTDEARAMAARAPRASDTSEA